MAEVLHHDKLKNRSDIAAIDRHNRRLSSGKQEGKPFAKEFSRANVDPNLTKYNQQLVPFPHASLLEAVDAAIAERVTGIVRRTSVKIISYIVSADEDFFTPAEGAELDASGRWDKKKLESWTTASMEFLKKKYGEQNLLSATLHLDEKTPHIHVAIVPITKDGRLSAFDWLGSPKKCRDIQTEYDRAVGHLGLQRGLKGSVATHKTVRRFYAELEKKLENIPEPPPKLPPEKGFPGSEKRKKYNEISEQREQFAQQVLKLVDETGGAVFTKAAEYDALKEQLEKSQKNAAFYKEKYEAVKASLDTATLRGMDLPTVAQLFGYQSCGGGRYVGHAQELEIDGAGFEFTIVRKKGKNAIDFVRLHLELTEGRHVTPAEAIVRLAGVADDPRRVADTVRQIGLDEAEEQLAPLRPQFAAAVEAERQRQEERKRKEKREAAEAAARLARLAELEAAEARARQQMEQQQPGQPEPEPEPEPEPTPPPPQLETPPPPAPEPEPEPEPEEPEPEEPEPGMSMSM